LSFFTHFFLVFEFSEEELAVRPFIPEFDPSGRVFVDGKFKLANEQLYPQAFPFAPNKSHQGLMQNKNLIEMTKGFLQVMPCLPILMQMPPMFCFLQKFEPRITFTAFPFVVNETLKWYEMCRTGQMPFHESVTPRLVELVGRQLDAALKDLDTFHDNELDKLEVWNLDTCNRFIDLCYAYCFNWVDLHLWVIYELWFKPFGANFVPPFAQLITPRVRTHLGQFAPTGAQTAIDVADDFFMLHAQFYNLHSKNKCTFNYKQSLKDSPPNEIFLGYLTQSILHQYFDFLNTKEEE
jgi:hypothetical protein